MRVTQLVSVASLAGFCFGVKRAVELVEQTLAEGPVYTLGPIIHNPQVVARLNSLGARVADSVEEIPQGARIVIRSHGVGEDVYRACQARGLRVVDATCPCVQRIHERVHTYHEAGYTIVIVGERDHPEVEGINGWCGHEALVINRAEQAAALRPMAKVCVVAQTTIARETWEAVNEALSGKAQEMVQYCTICDATASRQRQAQQMAREMDRMIVIGGANSANTQKLYQLCKVVCPHTYAIEQPQQLAEIPWKPGEKIGITAGSSTPDWIIKEVVSNMSDMERNDQTVAEQAAVEAQAPVAAQEQAASQEAEQNPVAEAQEPAHEANSDMNFVEDFEKTLVRIRNGQIITGTVVQVNDNEVSVNIGYKSDGFIPRHELSADNDVNPHDLVKVGDEIEVEVLKVNDGEGNVLLSKKNVDARKAWEVLAEQLDDGAIFEGVVKEVVKGGLLCNVQGIRCFVPASHVNTHYVANLSDYVGKTLRLKALEMDRSKRRIVASHKEVMIQEAAEKKAELWSKLEVGQHVQGTVRRLADFGAFIDIGGLSGLCHITDLSWGRIKTPADVVKPGDKVEVVILALNPERERISLGYKQLQPKPWDVAEQKYPIGSIVTGRVVRIVSFGAFVELEPGLDGLVHISQIAPRRIEKVEDVLTIGDEVQVKVLDVNPADRRISLSIRAAQAELAPEAETEAPARREPASEDYIDVSNPATLGELFPDFNPDTVLDNADAADDADLTIDDIDTV